MAKFQFKSFAVDDHGCGMKVCTDSVLLGAWAQVEGAPSILDLGCGSGVLALICAQRNPHACILAIDCSPEAVAASTANFRASPWPDRLRAKMADALVFAPQQPVDLIICNPPYFSTGLVSPHSLRATARHGDSSPTAEGHRLLPTTALDLAARWLAPDGSIAMVTPYDLAQPLICHAEMLRLKLRRLCRVTTVEGKQPTRALWQFSRSDGPIEQTAIAIRSNDGQFCPDYMALTRDLYINF